MSQFSTFFGNKLHAVRPIPDAKSVMQLLSKAVSSDANPQATPSRAKRLSSFNARVLDLAPGESTAKLRAVDPACPVDRLKSELAPMREQVRNATTPAVTKAKEHHKGSSYTIEVGDLLMPSGAMFVIAVVTRLT